MFRFLAAIAAISLGGAANAGLFGCSEWSNASLSHRGDVLIQINSETLEWRTEGASSIARSIRQGGTFAAYVDDTFVYFAFGELEFDSPLETRLHLVRRVPFTKNEPRIGVAICN